MTLCIGLICSDRHAIVTASDQMISWDGGAYSSDNAVLKFEPVHPDWSVMFAGDVYHVNPILAAVRRTLCGGESKQITVPRKSVEEVRDALVGAYRAEVFRSHAEILSPFNLTLDTFRDHGPKRLGDHFDEYDQRLFFVLDFLVFGFDPHGAPHLLSVKFPGEVQDQGTQGYYAIGIGQATALSMLSFRGVNTLLDVPLGLYRVCEAKFFGEQANGVGPKVTIATIHHAGRRLLWLDESETEHVKKSWNRIHSKRPHIVNTMSDWLTEKAQVRDGIYGDPPPVFSESPLTEKKEQ